MKSQPAKNDHEILVLAIDIGGTKIGFSGFKASRGEVQLKPLISFSKKSGKGIPFLRSVLLSGIQELMTLAHAYPLAIHPLVGVGTPGKLCGEHHTFISSGTAKNMESFSGEFDLLDLENHLFKDLLPSPLKPVFRNDALDQLEGALVQRADVQTDSDLVGYIGPGTGLGGGFCTFKNGTPSMITDGHIFDILIPSADGQIEEAEWRIAGTGFLDRHGVSLETISKNPDLIQQYLSDIKKIGQDLATLILLLHEGKIRKSNLEAQWPQQDVEAVKGILTFLMGGSISTKPPLGPIILEEARKILKKESPSPFRLIPIPDPENAALLGGAKRALQTLL